MTGFDLDELKALILQGENETLEFKETTGQRGDACETLCAFMNCMGGVLLFGVSRQGRLTGQLVSDKTRRELFEAFQRFEPAADIDVDWVAVDERHQVIVCRVERGNGRPYVYDGRPYKRMQSSTTVMGQEEYEQMLAERGGFRSDWENQVNPRLSLEEIDLEEVRKSARMAAQVGRLDAEVDLDDVVLLLRKFKVMRGTALTNGAAVLFGNDDLFGYPQCEIKMARFKGTGKNEFGDERRDSGNIFKLLSAATQFCFKHLNLEAKVVGFEREEHLELPPEALREAILNALVHRQYAKNGSVSLAIYDDRLVVTSPGGFPPGKTVEQIIAEHESEPRNQQIAHVLYLRKTIEAWGRGFDRIKVECEKAGVPPPVVEDVDGYVRLTFLRQMLKRGEVGKKHSTEEGKKTASEVGKKATPEAGNNSVVRKRFLRRARLMLERALSSVRQDARENMIVTLGAMADDPSASILRLSAVTNLPRGTVRNAQEMLKELGYVFRVGGDRGGHWVISWKGGGLQGHA